MRRSRRHRRSQSGVEMNLAAMLDMAFQLLAFFILTFRPAPVEGHLQLHMPPAVPLTNITEQQKPAEPSNDGVSFITPLDIYIFANDSGSVTQLAVGFRSQTIFEGPLTQGNLRKLSKVLGAMVDVQQVAFDQVQLVIDNRLRYDDLMKVVDVVTKQKLPNGQPLNKIAFVELANPDER